MRILLVVDTYFPAPKSAGKHFYDLAVELTNQGHSVSVLTPSDSVSGRVHKTVEDGIEIVRVKVDTLKHPSLPLRAFREALLPFSVMRGASGWIRRNTFELIVFYSPTIFWGPLVARLKRKWKCLAVLVLRDISPQWMLDAGIIGKGFIYFCFRRVELFQYRVADIIAVQSDGDVGHFAGQPKSLRKKVRVLYNWAPTTERFVPTVNFREKLGLEGRLIFFYGGTFGRAQNMESVVNLAIRLRELPSAFVLLAGSGTEERRIKARMAAEDIQNMMVHPPVSQREFLALVSEIDIGIISLSPKLRTHNIPGKILSYAYFAKPVLANLNVGADLGPLLEKYEAGLVSESGNDDAFFANAIAFAKDEDMRMRMGRNNRTLLESRFSSQMAVRELLGYVGR